LVSLTRDTSRKNWIPPPPSLHLPFPNPDPWTLFLVGGFWAWTSLWPAPVGARGQFFVHRTMDIVTMVLDLEDLIFKKLS
jgi:hypothetical protein